jgi:Ca-activated chloride channel homolog
MIFRHPWLLLLALLIPALLWARHGRRRRRPAVRFTDHAALRAIPPGWAVALQPLLPALHGVGLLLLVVALARPQKGLDESKVHTEAVDIVLLLDVSTSMEGLDFSTAHERMNRLDAAKRVVDRFVKARPDDRIGMVAFAAVPYTAAPLTLDHGWLLQRLEQIKPGMVEDGTAIGDALASACNRLRDSEAKSKMVVLLTDGVNNRGEITPENAALAAKALGIRVYAVGAASHGLVPYPVRDMFGGTHIVQQPGEFNEESLQQIAKTTGAQYFRATDFESLQKVYDEIDRMEKTEIKVEQYTRFEERFMPFLWAGLCCLAMERLLALTRLGRLTA